MSDLQGDGGLQDIEYHAKQRSLLMKIRKLDLNDTFLIMQLINHNRAIEESKKEHALCHIVINGFTFL